MRDLFEQVIITRQDFMSRSLGREVTAIKFIDKLLTASRRNHSLLCIGLDPDPGQMPDMPVAEFNRMIIDATADLVCAYKPNIAFYEALAGEGMKALHSILRDTPSYIPVIADAKRGDIGNTSRMYARAIFDNMGFDATTVSPYMGTDSLEPFLEYEDKGVFVLCRTSNPGSRDFQSLLCQDGQGKPEPLYMHVARRSAEWNERGNVGLVVGATHPDELTMVRETCPDIPLLIPGIGAQGGDLEATVRHGTDANREKAIIVSSRQILYASKGRVFPEAARRAAMQLRDQINHILSRLGSMP